jgi:zinc transport system permease protein
MAIYAAFIGVCSVIAGLFGSLNYDTPSGPSIVVASVIFFAISMLPWQKLKASLPSARHKEPTS